MTSLWESTITPASRHLSAAFNGQSQRARGGDSHLHAAVAFTECSLLLLVGLLDFSAGG